MADISALSEQAFDDIEDVEVPNGTWLGELKNGKYIDDGHSDKIGDYARAQFIVNLSEPVEGVDAEELAKFEQLDGYSEAVVFHSEGPLWRRSDFTKLRRLLHSLGVSTKGRSIKEVMKDSVGGQQVMVEVSREESDDVDPETGENKVYMRTRMFAPGD